jgi:uncharacterized sulfatase
MKRTLVLLAGLVVAVSGRSAPAAVPRPNILWITCEDASPTLGCYGDAFAVTPNLDRFAAGGVRYTNAFSVCGVCAVGRSCLITGVYPVSLGSHHMRCQTQLPEGMVCFSELLRRAGYYCTNNVKTDYNFPVPKNAWDACSRTAHWRGRAAGQPFFAVFNFTCSHESQIRCSEKRYEEHMKGIPEQWRHDPAKVTVPPYHPDTPEVRRDWARYYDVVTSMDAKAGRILRQLEDDGLAGSTIVFFYSDHGTGLPRMKKWIYDAGARVPLIVRFPRRYAAWAPGPRGSATDRLVSFVDFAPTALSLAGVPVPAYMQGRAFLGPQTGTPRRYVHLMRSRMAERYELVRGVRDGRYLYLRNYMPHLTYSQHISYTYQMPTMQAWDRLYREGTLTGPPALWFRETKPLEELYDTVVDPHQIRNLAGSPARAKVLDRLRREHAAWLEKTGDLGFLPEYEQGLRGADTTPYELSRDRARYPLKRIVAAADLVGRGPDTLPRLLENLGDRDAAVRYWSAEGLEALGPKASPAEPAVRAALGDPSLNVRIAAAAALVAMGSEADVMPVLLAGVRHESEWVRLRALNVLDDMQPAAARPARPDIEKALKAKSRWGYDHRLMRQLLGRE